VVPYYASAADNGDALTLPNASIRNSGNINAAVRTTAREHTGSDSIIAAGGVLIDKTKLLSNGKRVADEMQGSSVVECSSISDGPNNTKRAKVLPSEAARADAERNRLLQDLLNRKSSHADAEELEWFNAYEAKLYKLQAKEAVLSKENEKTVISVRAFQCKECNVVREQCSEMCRSRGHHVTLVNAPKRFFECQSCRRRTFTLGPERLPDRACGFCGAYSFIATGRNGSGLTGPSPAVGSGARASRVGVMGERLVTSASEWSSRADQVYLTRGAASSLTD
jgi:hypothetical protein